VSRTAEILNVRAMLVGGAVRDLFLGHDTFDIDILVEYEFAKLALSLQKELSSELVMHPAFGTAVLTIPYVGHIDIATARTETYARAGSLPKVVFSSIQNDLFRRDFSINAMAAPLTGSGEIIDPFDGLRDLSKGILRVLHPRSFQDDPTRIFRLARFASRGLTPENETVALACRDAQNVRLISIERVREELIAILDEKQPSIAISLLASWGIWNEVLADIPLPDGAMLDSASSVASRLALLVSPCGQSAKAILTRLKLSRALKREVLTILS